jgi:hypothetical protein
MVWVRCGGKEVGKDKEFGVQKGKYVQPKDGEKGPKLEAVLVM